MAFDAYHEGFMQGFRLLQLMIDIQGSRTTLCMNFNDTRSLLLRLRDIPPLFSGKISERIVK